jgi:beta-glucanase (GH16 family)
MKYLVILLLYVARASAFVSIGCYSGSGINWLKNGVKLDWTKCKAKCVANRMPLLALKSGYCFCGVDVPSYTTKRSCTGNYQFFYVYNGINCNIPNKQLNNWSVQYGWDKLKYFGSNSIELRMQYQSGGTLVSWDTSKFGISCIRMKISGVKGAISAFYMTSAFNGANQDEIDYEFINAKPCIGGGCLWSNQFISGKEHSPTKFENSQLKSIMGNTFSISNAYHNYCVDWQPNRITWYIDNKYIRSMTTYIPQKSLMPAITLWTDVGGRFGWGGTLPMNAPPVYSYFADYRLLGCY